MKQFVRFKTAHPDCLLLFRMGDFYELFGPDAEVAHQALGITLTERSKGMPMAGVPFHSIESYLRRLVDQGHRVAVCDQVQDPKEAKGVVDRAVTRVLTPGTLVDEALLDAGEQNIIAAVAPAKRGARVVMGIATIELSTGESTVQEISPEELPDALARIDPAELLLPDDDAIQDLDILAGTELASRLGAALTRRSGWIFRMADAQDLLHQHYGVNSLEGYGLEPQDPVIPAAGGLLRYLMETQSPDEESSTTRLGHLRPPRRLRNERYMTLDLATLRSLEIDRTSHSGEVAGSLRSVFSHCRTPMGRRLLKFWLYRPLVDIDPIQQRQRGVAELVQDRTFAGELREACGGIQDVARIGGRIAVGRATPRDLVALAQSILVAKPLVEHLAKRPALASVHAALDTALVELAPLAESIRARCVEHPPAHLREGGLMQDGVDSELDEARRLTNDQNSWLAQYQAQITEESGIPSLKVGFNKVFGYYIEISLAKVHEAKIPPAFVRKQTLKNAERYITPELKEFEEKVLGAEARAVEREKVLFAAMCSEVAQILEPLARFADAIGELDCLACFAETAHRLKWCRPTLEDSKALQINQGRHPVLDEMMHANFVPNDCTLGCDDIGSLALITGPNMAGKSTYIRQTALIVLLAQAGSFVPAKDARIGVADRIFTRVGASDELHAGRSTFMVEMTETANILHNATERSVVILDEIGRGTSTLDGLSLAWAITETLLDTGARTLFATHYHELTSIADRDQRASNLHVSVREWQGSIVFLHLIKPGRTDRSYGIHVAELAGLPSRTTTRAQEILQTLEVREGGELPTPPPAALAPEQMSLFKEYLPHPAIEKLRKIDLEQLSPMDAFETMRRILEDLDT